MDIVNTLTPQVAETNAAVTDWWKRQCRKPCCTEHKLTWGLVVVGWLVGGGIAVAAGGGAFVILGVILGALAGAAVGKLIEACRGQKTALPYQQMPPQQQPNAGMPPFAAQPSAPPMQQSMPPPMQQPQFVPAPSHDPQFTATANASAVTEAFNSDISTPYAAL